MQAKLTLKLEAGAIGRAKSYINVHRKYSLSNLVENYFNSLTRSRTKDNVNKLPPIVSGLAGIAKKTNTKNSRNEYTEYLMEKYK
jgi:hypothetical protein